MGNGVGFVPIGITIGSLVESEAEEPAVAVVAPPDRAPRVDVEPLEVVERAMSSSTLQPKHAHTRFFLYNK